MANSGDLSRLLALEASVRTLQDQAAANTAELEVIRQGITELSDTLRGLAARQDAETHPPILWDELDEMTAASMWEWLVEWMRKVLIPRFPDSARALRPCWPKHAQAVEALTQLWQTHVAAWDEETTDPVPRAKWITDTLPDLMGQVAAAVRECSSEHPDDLVLPVPDDLLPDLAPTG